MVFSNSVLLNFGRGVNGGGYAVWYSFALAYISSNYALFGCFNIGSMDMNYLQSCSALADSQFKTLTSCGFRTNNETSPDVWILAIGY